MKVYVPTGVFGARVKFSVSNGIVVVPLLATATAEAIGALAPTSMLVSFKLRLFESPVVVKVAVPGLFAVLNGELNDPMLVVKKLAPECTPVEGVANRKFTDSTLPIELAPTIWSVSWSPTVEPGVVVIFVPLMEIVVCPNP